MVSAFPFSNNRLTRLSLLLATSMGLFACGSLPAASKVEPLAVVVTEGEACGAFPTVTYRAAVGDMPQQLTIMAGDQPTPGYQIIVTNSQKRDDHIDISYRIQGPPPGSFLPQMMTRPCINVELPEQGWSSLKVTNQETEQAWQFNRDVF